MKKVFPKILGALVVFTSVQGLADLAPALTQQQVSTYFREEADFYMWKVNKNAPAEGQYQCTNNYAHILNKGSMDIVYVMGYLDDAGGKASTIGVDGTNYGVARSSDEAISNAILAKLTEPCKKSTQKLCEFSIIDRSNAITKLGKNIQMFGRSVRVNITLGYSSVSEIYEKNITSLKSQQELQSRQAEALFLNGIRTADVAIYNGHSRNGGGPDFAPPVLKADNHTNYAHYLKNRIEIGKVLSALKDRRDDNLVLGLFSCSSNPHFSKRLLSVNPKQKMILSGDTMYTNETTVGSLGYLESMMRGLCGDELTQAARQSDRMIYGFSDYNMK